MSYIHESQSIGDLLRKSCKQWGDHPAALVPEKGSFSTITYSELWLKALQFAGGLRRLGLKRGERIAIFAESGINWALADWGSQILGLVVVPIYPTLPRDQAEYILQDSGAKVVLAGDKELAQRISGTPHSTIVSLGWQGDIPSTLSFKPEEALSESEADATLAGIKPDDMATIIYTSGTTGNPKGAMLAHHSFIFLCGGVNKSFPVGHDDTFLSFLPMSHVYERSAGHFLPMALGATVAYAGSVATLASDMGKVKPTVMLCVPRFLESVKGRVLESVAKDKPIKQFLFRLALSQGLKRETGKLAPLALLTDALVGKKIRERMGGRIRFLASAGSALPHHVAEFYIAFRLKVLQGYGLTETSAITCVNHPDRSDYTTVGEPIDGIEVSIAPDGEILVRGPNVMLGYYHMPEATAEAIDAEGWFHTGDIGKFEGPRLKITDRKKDILVLANGKNIAPQNIEGRLRESSLIAEAVLFGDNMEYVCALIVPEFDALKTKFKLEGGTLPSGEAAATDPQVRKFIKAEIDALNKSLADFEKVKKFEILTTPFTIESGELTPSLKVKRKVVQERYSDRIKSMMRQ